MIQNIENKEKSKGGQKFWESGNYFCLNLVMEEGLTR